MWGGGGGGFYFKMAKYGCKNNRKRSLAIGLYICYSVETMRDLMRDSLRKTWK